LALAFVNIGLFYGLTSLPCPRPDLPAIFLNFHSAKQLPVFIHIIISLQHLQSVYEVISELCFSKTQPFPTIIHIKNGIQPLLILSRMKLSFTVHALSTHQAFHNTIKLFQQIKPMCQ
jgi:hypothetical protein